MLIYYLGCDSFALILPTITASSYYNLVNNLVKPDGVAVGVCAYSTGKLQKCSW